MAEFEKPTITDGDSAEDANEKMLLMLGHDAAKLLGALSECGLISIFERDVPEVAGRFAQWALHLMTMSGEAAKESERDHRSSG